MTRRSEVAIRVAVVLGLAAVVVVAGVAGGFDALRDGDRVEEFLTESGAWGPVLFILAFVALQPLSLPGALLIIPATFVWSWWEVTIYSVAGGMVASTVGFVLARWLAREWVSQRVPARFRTWEQRLADHGFAATVGLRLLTGYAPAADWLLGVSRVSVSAFLLGTIVGLTPATLAMAVWGDDAARGVADAPPLVLITVAVGALALFWSAGRARRRGDTG